MTRFGGGLLAWLLAATAALGADWRDHLPADWLLVAETPRLEQLDTFVSRLATPWQRPIPPLRATLGALAPGDALADRAWAIAIAPDATGAPTFVLYAPTDDFDALCEAFDADRADDLALANLFGFDVVIEPLEGWARVSLIDSATEYGGPREQPSNEFRNEDTVRVTLSEKGCRLLAEHLEAIRQGQIADRRRRYGPLRWPNDFKTAIAKVAPYAPVTKAIAEWNTPLSLAARAGEETLTFELTAEVTTPTPDSSAIAPSLATDRAILWLEAPSPMPEELFSLWAASAQSRPDRIEAPEYPQPQWDDFTAACHELARGIGAVRVALDLPTDDEPAAANQRAAFAWDAQSGELDERLSLCVDRWNTMLDAARARTPLPIELTREPATGGFRLRTDLIASTGLEPSPEIEAIFDRYYGAGRWAVAHVIPAGGDRWVATMRPGAAADAEPTPIDPSVLMHGELRLDRLTAWRQRLDNLLKEDAIGHRVRPPMREAPPVAFEVNGNRRLRLSITAPLNAYDAAVDYYRQDAAPIDDD